MPLKSSTVVFLLALHSIGLWNDVTAFTVVVGPTTTTTTTTSYISPGGSTWDGGEGRDNDHRLFRYPPIAAVRPSSSPSSSTTLCMATVESSSSSSGGESSSKNSTTAATTTTTSEPPTNPMLNGKRVLPLKILQGGLKSSTNPVAAVYVVLNSDYGAIAKQATPASSSAVSSWTSYCEHVGTTTDLQQTLNDHVNEYGPDRVSYIRAISFSIPNVGAMESIASDWRRDVIGAAAGKTNFDPILAAMDVESEIEDDDDDDFDDDDDDDYFEMMAGAMSASRSTLADARGIDVNAEDEKRKQQQQEQANNEIVSPFEQYSTTSEPGSIPFNKDSVDKVLEEIRPYLISDGGNVSVERVEEQTQDVYLKLEGACGSCPSSTVTMQMGIERVLKENFPNLGQVLQVEDETGETESEFDIVQQEVDRIKPAIIAMGGKVDIINVDAETGIVQLNFEGASRVRQGLELALLDIDFVQKVDFESC